MAINMDLKKAIDDILKNIGQERLKQICDDGAGLYVGTTPKNKDGGWIKMGDTVKTVEL